MKPSTLPSLTGLRFLAAFGVFAYHCQMFLPSSTLLRPLLAAGQAGVSFFFILSGFVLTWSARLGDRPLALWRRRAARILPAYLLTWLVGIPVTLAFFGSWPRWPAVLATGMLMQSWFDDKSFFFGVNGVAWSLSCEVFFYALLPVLLRLVLHRSTSQLQIGMLLGVCVLLVVQLTGWYIAGNAIAEPSTTAFFSVAVLPVGRLPEFLLGMLAAQMVKQAEVPRIRLRWAAPAALMAAYAAGWFPTPAVAGWLTALPFTALICAAAVADRAGASRVLGSKGLVRLGQWSFAFYLSHQLVIRLISLIWPQDHWRLVQLSTDLLLAVSVSAVLYHLVEAPAERRLRERTRRSSGTENRSAPIHRGY